VNVKNNATGATDMTTQPLTQEQIDAYVAHVQALQNAYFAQMGFTFSAPPKVTFDMGPRYVRIVKNDCDKDGNIRPTGQKSVHTFLDRTNGDILKGSWKAPVKNGVRGNVNDPNHHDKINHHGAVYLR
jgi:hypothetical protein